MDKVKNSFNSAINSINTMIQASSGDLVKIIKESNEMLNANLRLSKESNEAIFMLKTYAEKESSSLQEALLGVSSALETIEINRKEMVSKLQTEYISPLKSMLDEWNTLQDTIYISDKAENDLESKERSYDKSKAKTSAKVKFGEVEEAESKLQESSIVNTRTKEQTSAATTKFKALKVTTLKNSFHALASIGEEFYAASAKILSESAAKVRAIDVEKALEE
jgi:hypothetical protein